jgi:hypothetical protein
MLTIVTFKWSSPGYRSKFGADQVNIMRAMVARHYGRPHRFVCITDDTKGIDARVETFPIWNDHARIPNPTWKAGPGCYRRLKVFSNWFKKIGGDRFVCLDLDAVIVGNLSPIFDKPGDMVTYSCPGLGGGINGSIFMMDAGSRSFVWDLFDPIKSPAETTRLGHKGSDQGWMNACLQHCSEKWTQADGIYEFKDCRKRKRQVVGGQITWAPSGAAGVPQDARIIFFHGKPDPWDKEAQEAAPWILDHYR